MLIILSIKQIIFTTKCMEVRRIAGSLIALVPTDVLTPLLSQTNLPDGYSANRADRDGNLYHVTVVHSSEVSDKHLFDKATTTKSVTVDKLFCLGIGRVGNSDGDEAYFIVVHHPQLNKIRKELQLDVRPVMHITLGFKFRDIHGVDKGLNTIYMPNSLLLSDSKSAAQLSCINSLLVLQYIEEITGHCSDKLRILRCKKHLQDPSLLLSKLLQEQVSEDTAALIRHGNYIGAVLADELNIHLRTNSALVSTGGEVQASDMSYVKRGIELYDCAVRDVYDSTGFYVNRLVERFNAHEMGQPAGDAAKRRKLAILGADGVESSLVVHEMPRNFSWVLPGLLGGISKVRSERDLQGLMQLGIKTVYYFLEQEYFSSLKLPSGFELKYIHCENERVPSLQDMDRVLRSDSFTKGPVVFGCLGGFGRTGTALACYLVQHGFANTAGSGTDSDIDTALTNPQLPSMNANEAVNYLRSVRPKSIENAFQLSFVHQYVNHLYDAVAQAEIQGSTTTRELSMEPATVMTCVRSRVHPAVKLIMLCGLPGAGKSTFCELFSSSGLDIVFVNQDQLGRSECEGGFLQAIRNSDVVVLDRTNLTAAEREYWLDLSTLSASQCLCIHLATPKFICVERAKARKNHPTIREGGGSRIITDAETKFEAPTANERFSRIVTLEDEEDVRNYLKTWNCSRIDLPTISSPTTCNSPGDAHRIDLVKFPRTQHLINLGAASRDDLLLPETEFQTFFHLCCTVEITEKVDGAQLGFSLDENFKVRAQNRSHYVSSKSHSQFQLLDKYIFQHTEALYQVLTSSQYVLFGEWLYAKHSIGYTRLPSLFLAFDLFDKETKTFCSRTVLEEKLRGTNISIVPLLYAGVISDQKQLMAMLESTSQFSDSKLEGLYLKINDESTQVVRHRSKIVRSDFLCGNSHWSKNVTERNTVQEEF